jgi:hypothetical protein
LKGIETLADINESLSQIIKAAAQGELSIDGAMASGKFNRSKAALF